MNDNLLLFISKETTLKHQNLPGRCLFLLQLDSSVKTGRNKRSISNLILRFHLIENVKLEKGEQSKDFYVPLLWFLVCFFSIYISHAEGERSVRNPSHLFNTFFRIYLVRGWGVLTVPRVYYMPGRCLLLHN